MSGIVVAAVGLEVAIEAALTNNCGWTMEEMEFGRTRGAYYLDSRAGRLRSPEMNFCITSVVAEVMSTSTRNCLVVPLDAGGNERSELARELAATSEPAQSRVEWVYDDQVRRLVFKSSAGRGSYYLYSLALLGESPILPPASFALASCFPTCARLSWSNPAPAVSNRLDLARLDFRPASAQPLVDYDFAFLTNSTARIRDCRDQLSAHYPSLGGERLYSATNSIGVLQLSNSDHRGCLLHSAYSSYTNLTLALVAARAPSDQPTLSIGYVLNSATSTIATLALSTDFTTNHVALASMPENSQLILNHAGNQTNHRVYLRSLAILRDYVPACVETNVSPPRFTIGESSVWLERLRPSTRYLAALTAYDEYGNISDPADPLEFKTPPAKNLVVIIR